MKRLVLLLTVVSVFSYAQSRSTALRVPKNGFIPKDGFVPNADAAEAIAEAVLIPVYGTQIVHSEEPFVAVLNERIWVVKGKVPCEGPAGAACPGGAGEVWISKSTGQVLYMTHSQ